MAPGDHPRLAAGEEALTTASDDSEGLDDGVAIAAEDIASEAIDGEEGDVGRRRRKRPGRFRRWFLRPLMWGIASICVLLFVFQLLLNTRWARDWAKDQISHHVGAYFDRRVEIDDIRFQLVPLSVEIWGLTLHGPERQVEDENVPFLHVPWAIVEADLGGLDQRRLRLRQVRVERPLIEIAHFNDGEHNMVHFRGRSKPRPSRFELLIDRVEIDKAEFVLDQQKVEMSVHADAVRTRLRGLGDRRVGGQTVAKKVVIRLPRARPFEVSTSARWEMQRGSLVVHDATLSGKGFKARTNGTCQWSRIEKLKRNCRFHALGETRGELLADLNYHQDLAGPIAFDGTLDWRPGSVGWRSRVTSDALIAWGRRVGEVDGGLVADRYGTRFVLDEATYGGGTVRGEVMYEHEVAGRPTTVDLDFEGIVLDRLLADQKIPVEGSASRLDGELFYRFPLGGSQHGQGRAEVTLAVDDTQEGLPLAGAFPLRIEDGVLRFDSIGLISDQQSVLASGDYDLGQRRGAFDFDIVSADLVQLAELIPVNREQPVLWLPTGGEGSLAGTLYLEPAETSADVRLQFDRVTSPSFDVARATGSFFIDRQGVSDLRLELNGPGKALMLEGRVPFDLVDEQELDLSFDAFEWPMHCVTPWLTFDMPLGGDISGRLELQVGEQESRGKLRAELSPASMQLAAWNDQSVPFDTVTTRLQWDGGGIVFDSFDWRAASGELQGSGTYTWDGGMDLDLHSSALELSASPIVDFLPRAGLAGFVAAQVHLEGQVDAPSLDLLLEAQTLTLDGRSLSDRPSHLRLGWEDGKARLEGRLVDAVELLGGGRLGAGATDLDLAVESQDIAGLLELLFVEPPLIDGSLDGRLRLVGKGEQPLDIELLVQRLHLDLEDPKGGQHALDARQPATMRFTGEGIQIVDADLTEAATDSEFVFDGRVGYGAEEPMALNLVSRLDAAWLGYFDLGFDLEGQLQVDGEVGGTFASPTLDGRGVVQDGILSLGDNFPYPVSDLNGDVLFLPDQIVLQDLEGSMAEGTVELSGRADFAGDDLPLVYRIQATAQDLVLRYPEGWVLRGETDLTLRSAPEGHRIDGRANLESMEYIDDIRVDFEQLMRSFLEQQRLEVAPTDDLLSRVQLNVDVQGSLMVRNNLADLSGQADLVLRGNLSDPILFGDVDLESGGALVYNGLDYEIERGRILFANPYALDPELDLVATTRVRDFDVNLAVDGTFKRLETRFTSEPPLPALEVFRLLATGDTLETDSFDPRPTERSVEDPSTSAAIFLYGQAASVIGERVNRLFGFDKFRIDPLVGSGDNFSKARVTVGKRLSKDVFVTFSDDPTSTADQRLQVEWQVSPGLVLVLTQNGDDTYSADARWEAGF